MTPIASTATITATATLATLASLSEPAQINLLHQRFQEYGASAKLWSRQCQLLLPEIQRKQVWRRKGFESIYAYAAKLGGLSHWSVNDALRVLEQVADKPRLMALAVERGIGKVRPVVAIATKETEQFWAEKARALPIHALEKYVSDYRLENGHVTTDQPVTVRVSLPLYPEVAKRLAALRDNLPAAELSDRIAGFLDQVEQAVAVKAGRLGVKVAGLERSKPVAEMAPAGEAGEPATSYVGAGVAADKARQPSLQSAPALMEAASAAVPVAASAAASVVAPVVVPAPVSAVAPVAVPVPAAVSGPSRYIPAAIRRYVINKYRGRCAYPTCARPYQILHHIQRFALEPVHDPARLVPLCQAHERIVHQGLIAKEQKGPVHWRVAQEANPLMPDFDVDIKVMQQRRKGKGDGHCGAA